MGLWVTEKLHLNKPYSKINNLIIFPFRFSSSDTQISILYRFSNKIIFDYSTYTGCGIYEIKRQNFVVWCVYSCVCSSALCNVNIYHHHIFTSAVCSSEGIHL